VYDAGPIAFRYPRGAGVGAIVPERPAPIEMGKGRLVRAGSDVAILSFGARLQDVLAACDQLAAYGISPTVADARFAKPLDRALLLDLAAQHSALFTIEEGAAGGFGAQVAQLLSDEGAFDDGLMFRQMVLPDRFIDQATASEMYEMAGLSAGQIAAFVRSVLA